MLSGAKLRYIVGQSLKPQWIIVTKPEIKTVEDLRGKVLGYARVGAADYDEGATVMERFFNMKVGRDYKVIQFQGEPERIAAMANGDITGALVSVPRAYMAKQPASMSCCEPAIICRAPAARSGRPRSSSRKIPRR